MAAPKRSKPPKGSQKRAKQSEAKAPRKAILADTVMTLRRLSHVTGAQLKRRSTMVAEAMKKTAEEMHKTVEATADDMRRAGEEFTKAASTFDVKGMSKAWTHAYLGGLEAFFHSQEQTERLLKDTVKQGISGSQQILQGYEKWLEQIQGQAGGASPFVEWSRQLARSIQSTADPLFKTAADTVDSSFKYYEDTLAHPSRKYTVDLNKKVIGAVLSA
jgi:hypothetical protein